MDEQEEIRDKKETIHPEALLSSDITCKTSTDLTFNEEIVYPDHKSIVCKKQNMDFEQKFPINQIQSRKDKIQQSINNLTNPYYHSIPSYNPFSYAYNSLSFPSGCNNLPQDRKTNFYAERFESNGRYEERPPPYHPHIYKADQWQPKYDNLEKSQQQSKFSPVIVQSKDEHVVKTEPNELGWNKALHGSEHSQYKYMQPASQDKSFRTSLYETNSKDAPSQEPLYQRTSVIKSVQSCDLQYKARMLQYEGSILRHTGKQFL